MASLFSGLTVAVAGLNAQSSALGNISDNLSNAQTVGFKEIDTNFQDLVTSSTPTNNSPGGVVATPLYENNIQGNLIQSSSPTSLAIQGNGFFQVSTAAAGGTTLYTRQGDFNLNSSGYLVNSSGYYLQGYLADSSGDLNTSAVGSIQVSSAANNPVPTANASYIANLPAGASSSFTSATSSVQLFDSLGDTHTMSFVWDATSTPNTWDLNITVDGAVNNGGSPANLTTTVPVTFNSDGAISAIGSGSNYTVPNSASGTAADIVFTGAEDLDFTATGASKQPLTINLGTFDSTTNGVTQFASPTTTVAVTSFTQDGLPSGSFSNVSISNNGDVSLNFSNGSSKIIAQIPLVQFNAPDQLQRVSGDAFSGTLSAGVANTNLAGVAGNGTIIGGSLEASNVDIATQFTDMIQAQQIYSANAKTITTINNMLNTIINSVQ